MKYLYILILILVISLANISAQKSVKTIVNQLKKTENYEGINIPGWALYLGLKIAERSDDKLKDFELLRIAKHIKSVRVASTSLDQTKYNVVAIVNNFIQSVKEKDQFEEYVSMRSEDQNLKIMVQEKGETIKNILIFSTEGSDLACIHLKTNLHLDDLKNILFSEIKNNTSTKKSSI